MILSLVDIFPRSLPFELVEDDTKKISFIGKRDNKAFGKSIFLIKGSDLTLSDIYFFSDNIFSMILSSSEYTITSK